MNCSQTDQDEPERRRLDENSTDQAEARQGFRSTQPGREGGAQLDALRPAEGVLQVVDSAGQEDRRDHQSQEEQSEVQQGQELGKNDVHRGARSPAKISL